MSPARIATVAIWSLALAAPVFAQDEPPLPEGNAYVRSVISVGRPQDAAIDDYSYDLEESKEMLDGDGNATSRETRRYEVYFVKTRPVRRLVSRNGIPLSTREQAEVDRKAEAQAKAIAGGTTVSEQPGIRLTMLLDSFDFKTAGPRGARWAQDAPRRLRTAEERAAEGFSGPGRERGDADNDAGGCTSTRRIAVWPCSRPGTNPARKRVSPPA